MPLVNPGKDAKVVSGTVGFFLADKSDDLEAVMYYCDSCHRDVEDPKKIRKCKCVPPKHKDSDPTDADSKKKSKPMSEDRYIQSHATDPHTVEKIWHFIQNYPDSPPEPGETGEDASVQSGSDRGDVTTEELLYDSTGSYFWCPSRRLEAALMTRQEAAKTAWRNHIILCVLSKNDSQHIGLHSFVLPLRSGTIRPDHLSDIVILCDPKFMEEEWPLLWNFPRIKIVKGNALNRADLRAVRAKSCKMVVILGAPGIRESSKNAKGHQALLDKEVVIATLNVRDMSFPEGRTNRRKKGAKIEEEADYEVDDVADLLKKMPKDHQMGSYIPVITELARSNNVRFLDLFDQNPPLTEPYMAHPFACGRAVASSIVDSLTIMTFFHPVIFNIFNTLVFGQASSELEQIATEGAGLIGGPGISEPLRVEDEVIVRLVSVGATGSPFMRYAESPYGSLVIDALWHWDYICLGVYRKMNLYDSKIAPSKRFVITNPPSDFILHPTDLIYCLVRIKLTNLEGSKAKVNDSPGEKQQTEAAERKTTTATKKQKSGKSGSKQRKSGASAKATSRKQSTSSESKGETGTKSKPKTKSSSSESKNRDSGSTNDKAKRFPSDEDGSV